MATVKTEAQIEADIRRQGFSRDGHHVLVGNGRPLSSRALPTNECATPLRTHHPGGARRGPYVVRYATSQDYARDRPPRVALLRRECLTEREERALAVREERGALTKHGRRTAQWVKTTACVAGALGLAGLLSLVHGTLLFLTPFLIIVGLVTSVECIDEDRR